MENLMHQAILLVLQVQLSEILSEELILYC